MHGPENTLWTRILEIRITAFLSTAWVAHFMGVYSILLYRCFKLKVGVVCTPPLINGVLIPLKNWKCLSPIIVEIMRTTVHIDLIYPPFSLAGWNSSTVTHHCRWCLDYRLTLSPSRQLECVVTFNPVWPDWNIRNWFLHHAILMSFSEFVVSVSSVGLCLSVTLSETGCRFALRDVLPFTYYKVFI